MRRAFIWSVSNTVYLILRGESFRCTARGSESVGRMGEAVNILAVLKMFAPSPNVRMNNRDTRSRDGKKIADFRFIP